MLRVLHTLSVSLELDFGAEPFIVMGINQAVWELMQALQGENRAGKKKTHLLLASEAGSPLDDDVPYEGLCLLVELLAELSGSARAGVDDGGSDQAAELQPTKTSDVCLMGFEHVLGLLTTAEPLSVPRMRQALGKLTSAVFGLFSGRMILVASAAAGTGTHEPSLLDKAVQALSLCIKMDENETAQLGLESIVAFCKVVSVHFAPPSAQLWGRCTAVWRRCCGWCWPSRSTRRCSGRRCLRCCRSSRWRAPRSSGTPSVAPRRASRPARRSKRPRASSSNRPLDRWATTMQSGFTRPSSSCHAGARTSACANSLLPSPNLVES